MGRNGGGGGRSSGGSLHGFEDRSGDSRDVFRLRGSGGRTADITRDYQVSSDRRTGVLSRTGVASNWFVRRYQGSGTRKDLQSNYSDRRSAVAAARRWATEGEM